MYQNEGERRRKRVGEKEGWRIRTREGRDERGWTQRERRRKRDNEPRICR